MRTLTATLMLLSLHATAMDHEALSVLVEAGAIELKPRGLGGHSGESVVVDVHNRTARTLRTSIPAGWLFPSVNEGIQDLLVVRQEVIALAPNGRTSVKCRAFCCEAAQGGPGEREPYHKGRPAPAELIALAQFLDSGDYADDIVQHAVWVLSDRNDIASTGALDGGPNDVLRHRLSAWSGQPAPRYSVRYAESATQACSQRPVHVSRFVQIDNGTPQHLNVLVKRDDGTLITQLHRNTLVAAGQQEIPIELDVAEWPDGKYAIYVYTQEGVGVHRYPFNL